MSKTPTLDEQFHVKVREVLQRLDYDMSRQGVAMHRRTLRNAATVRIVVAHERVMKGEQVV